jgi:hypothetical protein
LFYIGEPIGSIVLFPISIVLSIVAIIFRVILTIGLLIYVIETEIFDANNGRRLQYYDDNPWGEIFDAFPSPPTVYILILIGLIFSPIILPILTLTAIGALIILLRVLS